jgi:O-antigen/teichoic acid export membrane protein
MRQLGALRATEKMKANVLANYIGKFWSFTAIYAFAPLYLNILGVSAYGLIAFYGVLLTILTIADVGLSASFAREAARESRVEVLLDQLRSSEIALMSLLSISAVAMIGAAPFIATQWLKSDGVVPDDVMVDCLRLMPVGLLAQVAMSLYFGGLMGRQRQVAANFWQMSYVTVRSAGVLIPLFFFPHPLVFFLWQAISGWVFLFLMRRALINEVCEGGAYRRGRFSFSALQRVSNYAVGMFAMAIISGVNSQLDRLVVSRMRPINEFAWYTLAATLAQIPTMVAMPIAAAMLPRFTQLVEAEDTSQVAQLYAKATYAIAILASITAGAIVFFADQILALWLPGQAVPALLPAVSAVLAGGGLFLALQLMPFHLSLAHGHSATNVRLGVFVLFASIPLQCYLTSHFGLLGAAVPWLFVGVVGFLVLGTAINRRFARTDILEWFIKLNLIPVAFCFGCLAVARMSASALGFSQTGSLIVAVMAACIAAAFAYRFRAVATRQAAS